MFVRIGLVTVLLSAPTLALAWGSQCAHSAQRELALDATQVSQLLLTARAGDLEVQGDPTATRIELSGRACASSAELLEQIQLLERRSGGAQSVDVAMPELSGGWGSNYASLDLTVVMPARMTLDLQDSSGDARIEALAGLKVRDSSGDLRVADIHGPVEISDSSGDIDVIDVQGDVVVLQDSSGDIDLARISGSARVEVDSSGDLTMRDIGGDATVERDSSGDIEMVRIGGSATVDHDGSGSIRVNEVSGDFRVGRDGTGGISHRGVKGQVSIPAS